MSTIDPETTKPTEAQCEEWTRAIRSLIEHENDLQDHRLTWLLTCEGFFFAALAFAWDKDDARPLIVVVSVLGCAIALLSAFGLRISKKGQQRQRKWWDDNVRQHYSGPDVVAYRTEKDDDAVLTNFRPWRYGFSTLFVIAWIAVLYCNWNRSWP
ncbi:MAG: hypothetical protein R3C53_16255 [Pirellulaceae bacterium]